MLQQFQSSNAFHSFSYTFGHLLKANVKITQSCARSQISKTTFPSPRRQDKNNPFQRSYYSNRKIHSQLINIHLLVRFKIWLYLLNTASMDQQYLGTKNSKYQDMHFEILIQTGYIHFLDVIYNQESQNGFNM